MQSKKGYIGRFAVTWDLPRLIAITVGIALIAVNVIRIFNVPITYDENGYGGTPTETYYFFMSDYIGAANDHVLHSLLRKFFVDTFGNNLFTLRVDNLIAQVFFFIFSYRLCGYLFKNKWWQLGGYIILAVVSPLIMDFWGLSRGYGLALACMMISVYYLLKYITEEQIRFLAWAAAFAILSVYSNFGYINYFLTLCATVVLQQVLFRNKGQEGWFKKELLVLFIASGILALMIVAPLSHIYKNGELAFMGNKGFVEDTIKTLASTGLFLLHPMYAVWVNVIVRFVIIVTYMAGGFWVYIYFKERAREGNVSIHAKYGITFFLLLILPALSLIAQHLLLGINYLTDRAALFFIILFTLQFIYMLYYLREQYKTPATVLFIAVFLITCYNFFSTINTNTTILWYFNAGDLAILRKINRDGPKPRKIKIGISWLSETTFRYDIEHYYPGRLYPAAVISTTGVADTSFDYFFIYEGDIPKLPPGYRRDTDCIGGSFILYKKN